MSHTTSIETGDLQLSLQLIYGIDGNGTAARISTNRCWSPAGQTWLMSQVTGRDGAGEVEDIVVLEDFVIVVMKSGTAKPTARAAVSRLLNNIKRNLPADHAELFVSRPISESMRDAMAVSSRTSPAGPFER